MERRKSKERPCRVEQRICYGHNGGSWAAKATYARAGCLIRRLCYRLNHLRGSGTVFCSEEPKGCGENRWLLLSNEKPPSPSGFLGSNFLPFCPLGCFVKFFIIILCLFFLVYQNHQRYFYFANM